MKVIKIFTYKKPTCPHAISAGCTAFLRVVFSRACELHFQRQENRQHVDARAPAAFSPQEWVQTRENERGCKGWLSRLGFHAPLPISTHQMVWLASINADGRMRGARILSFGGCDG